MTDLADQTIAQAEAGLAGGDFSSVDLVEAVLRRAAVSEAHLHAYLTVDRDGALEAARASDSLRAKGEARGPLDGIPLAVKDNMCTRGLETTCASKILAGYEPPYDATAVLRLRGSGAVVLGKTNLDEFAMGSSTENSGYGPTRNPWDTDRVPGGSSGGSAAAVAVGSALGAYGSDTGGSIRQPGSLCGIVGMKPTYGLVSRYGLIAFASSLDQIGPLARDVRDAATLLGAVAGFDINDATSYRGPVPDLDGSLDAGVAGLRIGVVSELMGDGIDRDVVDAVQRMVDALEGAGADVVEVSLPAIEYALSAYYLIAPAECSANLARFDGVRYGLRVDGATSEEMMSRTRAEGFGPEVIRRILLGTYALSAGYYDAYYGQAQRVRTLVGREFSAAVRAGRRAGFAGEPFDGLRRRREDRRPDRDVLLGRVHDSFEPHRTPRDFGAGGSRRRRPADRFPGDGARPRRGDPLQGGRGGGEAGLVHRPGTVGDLGGRGLMATWEAVIGLETHVELQTRSKMFCGCAVSFGAEPNTTCCPVCLGLPGALPVPNEEAIHGILRIGAALDCTLVDYSEFHRKNYFYPDLPKNYQISQYDLPICVKGSLEVGVDGETTATVGITRVHMEEDTGKSRHLAADGRIHDAAFSLLDFNRSGVPLVEIVSEPDIKSADEARAYAVELQRVVRALGVSDARLEEGSMRFDANVSVRPSGTRELGTRSEVKNVNSLRSLHGAIVYEIDRQIAVLEAGDAVIQETRHWREDRRETVGMRSKEESEDYRYFQEPDLVPMVVDDEWRARVEASVPELPAARRRRYQKAGLEPRVADFIGDDPGLARMFDESLAAGGDAGTLANWLTGEVVAYLRARRDRIARDRPDGAAPRRAAGHGGQSGAVDVGGQGGAPRRARRRGRSGSGRRGAGPQTDLGPCGGRRGRGSRARRERGGRRSHAGRRHEAGRLPRGPGDEGNRGQSGPPSGVRARPQGRRARLTSPAGLSDVLER